MKVYKFRKLNTEQDYCRLREIIETGKFWCSSFWDLNDPMEGIFNITPDLAKEISKIYGEKGQYKICSFSGKKGFKKPTMWGYYAGGFKGVAIEVEYDAFKQINYDNKETLFDNKDIEKTVEDILLNKKKVWKDEDEYRFLEKSKENSIKIGKITAIYFGCPYDNLENSEQIQKNRQTFIKYKEFKENIIKIAKRKKISYFDVRVIFDKITIKN